MNTKKNETEKFFQKMTIVIENRNHLNLVTNKITVESYEETLPELLRIFEQTLRGAGFVFDGVLEIIDEKSI